MPPRLNNLTDEASIHCQELSAEDVNTLDISNSHLSIIHVNIRSVRRNFSILESFLSFHNFAYDIICITETWLTQNVDTFNLDNYRKFCLYRNSHGGGIMIFLKNCFTVNIITDMTYISNEVEILSLSISNNSINFNLACIYRPPSQSLDTFNFNLSDRILPYFNSSNTFVCGDFNANLFNPSGLHLINNFISTFLSHNYFLLINLPTRYSPENPITKYSLLDQIWCNFNPPSSFHSIVFNTDIADHLPIMCYFKFEQTNLTEVITTRKLNCEENITNFITNVQNTDFISDTTSYNANVLASDFFDKIYNAYFNSFPLVSIRRRRQIRRREWMNDDLRRLIKKKHKLYKMYRKEEITRRSYAVYRNLLSCLIRKSKELFYLVKLDKSKNNSRVLWKQINEITNRKFLNETICIKVNDRQLSNSELCTYFNNHFSSIATSISNNIPRNSSTFELLSPRILNDCNFYPVTVQEVKNVMQLFKSKSVFMNDIRPSLLLRVVDTICPILCNLFNACFRDSIFPDCLKTARVIPIFKSGDKNNFNNYRPISNLTIFNKIFEKIIYNRIITFIDSENFIVPAQYGFKKDSSTTLAILDFISHVRTSFNNKYFTISLFLDLKKAFDTVDIEILLSKLEHYGFRLDVNKFFKHYFLNRKQYVNIGDHKSDFKNVTIGLTQGGILSPIIFNIFINDIYHFSKTHNFNVTLFADDAVFYISGPDFNALIDRLNHFISKLNQWLESNLLCPNTAKTKLMLFNKSSNIVLPDVYFNGVVLEWVDNFKYLGVFVDSRLSFSTHTMFLTRKISSVLGIMYASRSFLNTAALKTLYYSLVYSIIAPSIIIYGNTFNTHTNPIKILINKIVRLILNVKYDANRVPLLSTNASYLKLGFLKFDDIRDFFLLKFIRTALYFNPHLLEKYFSMYIPYHSYNTRQFRLISPPARTEILKRSTVFKCISLFNSLPDFLTVPMSHSKFKKLFKQFILERYRTEL